MDLARLAAMAQHLGLSVNLSAIGQVLPILGKRAGEVDEADVTSMFSLVGLNLAGSPLLGELVRMIHTSDLDRVSEILGSEQYFMPVMHRVIYSETRLIKKLIERSPLVPVKCPHCGDLAEIMRESALESDTVNVSCLKCGESREIASEQILLFGI